MILTRNKASIHNNTNCPTFAQNRGTFSNNVHHQPAPQPAPAQQQPLKTSLTQTVQVTMASMDEQWGTQFSQWIRNSSHASYTAKRLRPLVQQYPVQSIVQGLRWLLVEPECDWEVQLVEEFVAEVVQDLPQKTAKRIVRAVFE
jgi:hypothetical protein